MNDFDKNYAYSKIICQTLSIISNIIIIIIGNITSRTNATVIGTIICVVIGTKK